MKRRFRRRWWVLAGALALAAGLAPLLDPAPPLSVAAPAPAIVPSVVSGRVAQAVSAPAPQQLPQQLPQQFPQQDAPQPLPELSAWQAQLEPAFALALEQLRAGQSQQAVAGFEALIRRADSVPEFHVNLGFALLAEQRLADARDAFARAIELKPWQANAYYGLAVAADGLGDPRTAIGAMRTFVHLTPPQQPHVVRARAAIWEWQASLDAEAPAASRVANAGAGSIAKAVAAPGPVAMPESRTERTPEP